MRASLLRVTGSATTPLSKVMYSAQVLQGGWGRSHASSALSSRNVAASRMRGAYASSGMIGIVLKILFQPSSYLRSPSSDLPSKRGGGASLMYFDKFVSSVLWLWRRLRVGSVVPATSTYCVGSRPSSSASIASSSSCIRLFANRLFISVYRL